MLERENMLKEILRVVVFAHLCFSLVGATLVSADEFFSGKVVRIVVGASAGGGFDTYARTIARHLGRHIPGNPTIIVENMPGAGQRIAANHVYKAAKPDGLTLGNFYGGLLLGQILDQGGIEFDALKFEYVGVPQKDRTVCALTKSSGITSVEKWQSAKTPVKLGSTGTDDVQLYGIPKILNAALGLPVQVVAGYKGTADIRLAAEAGELAGACWGWDSIKATWRKAVDAGNVVVVLQTIPEPHPDLPKVPLAISLAKNEEARELIQVGIHHVNTIARPYVLPPGVPKDRVQLLRKSFNDTVRDRDFLADAEKSKLEVEPMSGEELERTVTGFFKLKPTTLTRLKAVLK